MINPFDLILERLREISSQLAAANSSTKDTDPLEIIDRKELQKRLAITEPTVIRWERKGKIPCLRIGSVVRYNWPAVIESLETKKKSGGLKK